jgi:hypothetical protein
MKKYWLISIALNNRHAIIHLGSYYIYDQYDCDEMIPYISMALSLDYPKFINHLKYYMNNNKYVNNRLVRCILNCRDNVIVKKHFNKFLQFYSSREKYIELAECMICFEESELIIFDCICHKQCISCYVKMNKCSLCNIPKNDYYNGLFS